MNIIVAIALLTGAAVAGIVWFGWALVQNARAAAHKTPAPANDNPTNATPSSTR